MHDPMFDAPGLNKFLQTFLSAELVKLTGEGIDVTRVKPLTVMNVDSLMMMAHLLNAGQLRLEVLLDAYQISWNYGGQTKYCSMAELMQEFNNSCMPLHGYLPDFLQARFGSSWRSLGLVRHLFDKFEVDGRELIFPTS
jgi:hypothetical protein